MRPVLPKPQRCAIYTRKSTEHNLDLAFNSLDAQREACEAYIKSQAHEGWRLIAGRFDDGGLSGASLERPALQSLLDQVRARKIDIIVVYKVDRLTRSLADFAKLVELFDEYGVSFVSITQSFNTTSSMGRLTLNVLLSFAQFEREVIGERVRDKIAASKRKGIWVGGPVSLGYRSVDKKLEVVPDEAKLVQKIFADYLRVGSIGALAASLDREQIRPRPRTLSKIATERFMVGPLAHILKNRFYISEIVYRGEVHRGEHEPILDRMLFDAVQARLAEQAVERRATRSRSSAILLGKIFDDRSNPMSPSHANKKGVRYRYYVSQAMLQGRKDDAGSVPRVSAPDIEALIVAAVRDHLQQTRATEVPNATTPNMTLPSISKMNDRDMVTRFVQRIVLRPELIEISLHDGSIDPAAGDRQDDSDQMALDDGIGHDQQSSCSGANSQHPTIENVISIRWIAPVTTTRKGILHEPTAQSLDPATRDALLKAIAKERGWMNDLIERRAGSFEEIAIREGIVERHARFLAPLAFVSPRIIEAIANGEAPVDTTISSLARALPHSWTEQELRLRLA